VKVSIIALEDLMRSDGNKYIEIPGIASLFAGLSGVRDAQPVTVIDTGGDLKRDLLILFFDPCTTAFIAGR
jgi:hypothetical protein